MIHRKHNYYCLEKEKSGFFERLKRWLQAPFKLPSWIVSFALARNITHITLNPSFIPSQRPIHFTKAGNRSEDDIIVVNFKRKPRYKWFNDLLLKLADVSASLPFVTPELRSRVHYDNLDDKSYIDYLLTEIDKLIQGTSTQKHCENRTFDWSQLHFKGLEFLDAKMKGYVYEQLDKKYGPTSYTTSRDANLTFFTLKTVDNAELDSIQVEAPGEDKKAMAERKFVITCIARDQNYINWIKDLNYTANNLGATAISFNYRGVDYSRGLVWTQNNMVDDVMGQVQRLIELGAKPENICLDGMCLGGAIATLAAAKLHEQHKKVKLNNERSFQTLPRLLFGYIAPEFQTANWWNPMTYLRFLVASIAYVIFNPILWLSGWYVDAASAWKKIPAQDKLYSVVRDEDNGLYDGVIHDQVGSIAALVDQQKQAALYKLHTHRELTEEEMQILFDDDLSHDFKPAQTMLQNPKFRGAHFIARSDLVAKLGHEEAYTNHDYFLDRLKEKFKVTDGLLQASSMPESHKDESNDEALTKERPLVFACSGGTGHISAALGIINAIRSDNPEAVIPEHRAQLYQHKPFSGLGWLTRIGVWAVSVPVLGFVVRQILRLIGYPQLPSHQSFWNQMLKIQQAELGTDATVLKGRTRPYVDMLLDVYPAGYEYTALNNAAHLSLSRGDIKTMTTFKSSVEEQHYEAVFDKTLHLLVAAAQLHTPYTKLVSTQALSLSALCDAVKHYNDVFLPKFNQEHGTSYKPINIHQYMTDLPALGCAHFMDNLDDLTSGQREIMEVYAVNMSEPIKAAYFGKGHGFKAVHNIDPCDNPMMRHGFKAPELITFSDKSCTHALTFKAYDVDNITGLQHYRGLDKRTINPHEKVASIMIGSLAATASADYVKHLLDDGFDHIFIFGGLNDSISTRLNQLLQGFSPDEQEKMRNKIICLGNQSDVEMAPIMTRSDCVIIRGGGLSVMEQMAMPVMTGKCVLMHHDDGEEEVLTSGLSWEDSNADRLIDYLSTHHGAFATKTSPSRCSRSLSDANAFHNNQFVFESERQLDEETTPECPKDRKASLSSGHARRRPATDEKKVISGEYGFFKTTSAKSPRRCPRHYNQDHVATEHRRLGM